MHHTGSYRHDLRVSTSFIVFIRDIRMVALERSSSHVEEWQVPKMSQAQTSSSIQLTRIAHAQSQTDVDQGKRMTDKRAGASEKESSTGSNRENKEKTQVNNPIPHSYRQDANTAPRNRAKLSARSAVVKDDGTKGNEEVPRARRRIRTSISHAVNELPSSKEQRDLQYTEVDGRNESIQFNVYRFIRVFLYHALYPVSLPFVGFFEGRPYLSSVRPAAAIVWASPMNYGCVMICRCHSSRPLLRTLSTLTFSR
eukprot:gb/GECG01002491.1/.p1 GENE.gb/GECG01002491.1/~~gb/GECG01002491.1/.p1  ORF type:complete len:254 (+),score=27.24 gb/GECG01002491.1/:1-762(+)